MAPIFLIALFVQLFLSIIPPALAERAQYCRFGHQDAETDFCMGVSSSLNATTNHHDLNIALSVRRSSPLGWTAIGTGPSMAGALMFVVYGDPSSDRDPVVSIRTTDSHHQPRAISHFPLSASGSPGTDVRVTHAKWESLHARDNPSHRRRHDDHDAPPPPPPRTGPTHAAVISLTCYSCDLFPGSSISATSSSQPWIWAWNDRQRFEPGSYTTDADLHMHRHGAQSGGFGTFYVDMARAVSDVPVPAIPEPFEEGVARLGTSDTPIGLGGWIASLWERPLPRAHAWLMSAAFLVVFPAGAVLIRLTKGAAKGAPFKRHWIVQAAAMGLAWAGAAVGALMTGGRLPKTTHQWLGAGIVLTLVAQSLFGWRHHMRFLRIRRRTWISHAHIWLGRTIVAAGWVNVLLGMLLAGVGLSFFLWRAQRAATKKQATPGGSEAHALMPRDNSTDEYFALELSDEEADGDMNDHEDGASKRELRNGDHRTKQSAEANVEKVEDV
ncbi:hypothetical protein MMYC01_205623 [Madurella mycetomatis]|uniref:Cytochrome b561 domain-containing protein n=1 Tax=Madurella mycetomatis TaxID=100816 RepID=A0A175W8D9_9PEZI|nr:hypothetical protein MMYC01_205623 [Madurella mycetomatis]